MRSFNIALPFVVIIMSSRSSATEIAAGLGLFSYHGGVRIANVSAIFERQVFVDFGFRGKHDSSHINRYFLKVEFPVPSLESSRLFVNGGWTEISRFSAQSCNCDGAWLHTEGGYAALGVLYRGNEKVDINFAFNFLISKDSQDFFLFDGEEAISLEERQSLMDDLKSESERATGSLSFTYYLGI